MKKYYFFGSFLSAQEKWLNKMASQGYRLVRTEKLLYDFETKENAENYKSFLENEMGYKVMFKNINLNYSVGKVRYRPWAENGGRMATNSTTFNRELLIIERENDEKPFVLHTSYDDMISYYKILQKPWLYMLILFGILGIALSSPVFGVFAAISLCPVILYQISLAKLKREASTKECE